MSLESLELVIEPHAYERYCERVKPISETELISKLKEDLKKGYRFRKGYLLTGEIWWKATWEGNVVTLFTCYGRSHMDLPAAIKWAKRYRDRIVLGDAHGD